MADHFCDTTLATGLNDGTTTDDAWQSIKTALEYASFTAGDKLWIRRVSAFTASTAGITPVGDGNHANPLYFIGCPRTTVTGTGEFVRGSKVVYGLSITPSLEAHGTRELKNDSDNHLYMIEEVVRKIDFDTQTVDFTLDAILTGTTSGAVAKIHYQIDSGTTGSLYIVMISGTFQSAETITDDAGGSATSTSVAALDGYLLFDPYVGTSASIAAFTIEADEDYTEFNAIDDSTWTIKLTTWNADAHDIPIIDFNSAAYLLNIQSSAFTIYKNLLFRNSTQRFITISYGVNMVSFYYCIVTQDSNNYCIYPSHSSVSTYLNNVIIKGSAAGTSQRGIATANGNSLILNKVSIQNMGDNGLLVAVTTTLIANKCNIGIATPNNDEDLITSGFFYNYIKDLNLGGKNGSIIYSSTAANSQWSLAVENYNHTLNNNKNFWKSMVDEKIEQLAVVAGSGEPYKRTGGADDVIKLNFSSSVTYYPTPLEWKPDALNDFIIVADTTSKSYRFYIQAKDMAITDATELYLECEYIDRYFSDTVYHTSIVRSAETITIRTGADDWSQYIEVTGIQPGVASNVILRIKCSGHYDVDGAIYIDPLVVIS